MKTTPQLDLQPGSHPDAESLAAFAEHLLPNRERQPLLVHLAACARCREALFLAQDAAQILAQDLVHAERIGVSALIEPKPARLRAWAIARRSNWPFALAAFAACALLIAISLSVFPRHPRPVPQPTVVGQLQSAPAPHASPVPQAKPVAPRKSPPPTPPIQANPKGNYPIIASISVDKVASSEDAAPAGSPAKLDAPNEALQPGSPVAVSSAAQPVAQSSNVTVSVASSDSNQIAVSRAAPVQELMPEQPIPSSGKLVLKPKSRSRSAESKAVAGPILPPAAGAALAASDPGGDGVHLNAALPAQKQARTEANEAAAQNTLGKTLPSGQQAIAVASLRHRLLALDSAGSLFLSEDDGAVWELVSPPWTARAVQVSLEIPSTGQALAPALAKSTPGALPQASNAALSSALFKVVTANAETWSSLDGRNWTLNPRKK